MVARVRYLIYLRNIIFMFVTFYKISDKGYVHLKILEKILKKILKKLLKNFSIFFSIFFPIFLSVFEMTTWKTALKLNSALIFYSFPVVEKNIGKNIEKNIEKNIKKIFNFFQYFFQYFCPFPRWPQEKQHWNSIPR